MKLERTPQSGQCTRRLRSSEGVAKRELCPSEIALLEVEITEGELNAWVAGREVRCFAEKGASPSDRPLFECSSSQVESCLHGARIALQRAIEEASCALGITPKKGNSPEYFETDRGLALFGALPRLTQEAGVVEQPNQHVLATRLRREPFQPAFEEPDRPPPFVGMEGRFLEVRLQSSRGHHVVHGL